MDSSSSGKGYKMKFEHKPVWFQRFLRLFNCDSIPKILFARATQLVPQWSSAGELSNLDANCLHLIHPRFEEIMGPFSWSERFTNTEDRRINLEGLVESEDIGEEELQNTTNEPQMIVLMLVASVFPEPWCEIVWEDVEEQLWEMVESACVPLLGVLDRDDLENFLEDYAQKQELLFILSKFMIRISVLLAHRTPPNLFELISQSIDLFRDYVKNSGDASQEDLEYLLLLRSIAEIFSDANQSHAAAERLQKLSHCDGKRANALIGFALASLPLDGIASVSKELLNWAPVVSHMPSTMEVLAHVKLFGADMLGKLASMDWKELSLDTKVLVGFSEARKKAFFTAHGILRPIIEDIETVYGRTSLELLLVGTTLVNCCNAIGREIDGESFGCHILACVFGSFTLSSSIGPVQQTHLMAALSDSFLGQGEYSKARELLLQVVTHSSTDHKLLMSATLRLLKMSRREREPSCFSEDWTRLDYAIRFFDRLPDIWKYECIEETVCLLSVLEQEQIAKISQIGHIIKTLTNYRISTYKGSLPSRVNLYQNLEKLKSFKSTLNLFSISGPQLPYCRKLRDRFLPASVQIIEKVGSANWQRFKRIKEMREMVCAVEIQPEALASGKSVFQDSGLGSSLGSDLVLSSPGIARSVASIRSFMSTKEDATLLPPLPAISSNGERICYICESSILDISNEAQWRRHAFSDLRPYVCVVDNCDEDYMNFTSRAEFAAHLTEHQHTPQWTCTHCGHSEETKELIQDHVNFTHATTKANPDQGDSIIRRQIHRDLSIQTCPFCSEIPGSAGFVGHLCHHLEEISLSAIPQETEVDGDDDEGSFLSGTTGPNEIEKTVATWFTDSNPDRQDTCPECGKVYPDIKAHMLIHQMEHIGRPEKCPVINCDYHTRGFRRKYDLKRHAATHYKGVMVCGFCPGVGSPSQKSFIRVDVFKRHLAAVHSADRLVLEPKMSGNKPEVSGKCLVCSLVFDLHAFYNHLDDCILRNVSPATHQTFLQPEREYELETKASLRSTASHLLRSGGTDSDEEPYAIKCICSYNDDDGNTILCENCDTWQHIECYYHGHVEDASKEEFHHACTDCNPRPFDRALATERQRQQRIPKGFDILM